MKKSSPFDVITKNGIFVKQFPIKKIDKASIKEIDFTTEFKDLVEVSDNFGASFETAGYMIDGEAYTAKVTPIYEKPITIGDIAEKDIDPHYYLSDSQKSKFKYLRGGKKLPRVDKKTGHKYVYSEGAMSPFDDLDLPARTMLTSEGTTNRSTHIIKDPKTNKLRLLTPVECERINQFPDNWTNSGMPEKRRYFMMGNALVCGIINKLGKEISQIIDQE